MSMRSGYEQEKERHVLKRFGREPSVTMKQDPDLNLIKEAFYIRKSSATVKTWKIRYFALNKSSNELTEFKLLEYESGNRFVVHKTYQIRTIEKFIEAKSSITIFGRTNLKMWTIKFIGGKEFDIAGDHRKIDQTVYELRNCLS